MKRKIYISVLCVALALALSLCVLAACNNDNDKNAPPVAAGPEGGTYYFDPGTAEMYTLVLSDNNAFRLVMDATVRNGKYSLAGSLLSLTFDDGNRETISAQLTNNYGKIAFDYNGKSYEFLRYQNFTVSFVTGDDCTQIEPQAVLNGKTAAKPANPKKNGAYVFEGWYSDAQHQVKYDFDTPVVGNVTLYANFIEAIRADFEYTATFAGEGAQGLQPIQTIQGVLYELYEPTKEGDTFVGWWVSDSNNGNKLTYMYNGQQLNENTVLYAVWQSQLIGGIAVSVTSSGVYWTGADEVSISILSPAGVTSAEIKAKGGEYLFGDGYTLSETGEYKISVKASGAAIATERYIVNNKLTRVSHYEVEGDNFKFSEVNGATNYAITLITKTGTVNANLISADAQNGTLVYDFSAYDIPSDGYVFTIVASADGYASSTSEQFKYNRFLNAVSAPTLDASTQLYSWQTVAHASRYVVKVNGSEVLNGNYTSLSFIDDDPGEYEISIQPFGFGYNAPAPTVVTFNKTKLAKPTGLRAGADGTTIVWDAVTGANGYTVYKGSEKLADVTRPEYNITGVEGQGAISISIEAKAQNAADNSPMSDALALDDHVSSISYAHNTISWNMVYGAPSYYVSINGGAEQEASITSIKMPLVAKTNTITVRPSNGSSAFSVTVNADEISLNLGYEGGKLESLFLVRGDDLVLPSPMRTGYELANWANAAGDVVTNGTFAGGDVTYTAKWNAREYGIAFAFEGKGKDEDVHSPEYADVTVAYDSSEFTLPAPVQSDDNVYAFEGWYLGRGADSLKLTDHLGNALLTFNFLPGAETGKVTLFAHWVEVFEFSPASGGVRVSKKVEKGQATNNIDFLTEITIPAMYNGQWVTAISDFSGLKNMQVLNIPSCVTDINFADAAVSFANDTALYEVNVYPAKDANGNDYNDAPKFSSIEGVLFDNDASGNPVTLRFCPLGKLTRTTEYTVPSGTREIASGAFYSSTNRFDFFKVTTINFPATLERIAKNAFVYISDITTLNFLPVQDGETEASGLVIEPQAFSALPSGSTSDFYCSSFDVVTIHLPKRFNATSFDVFTEFDNLESITVEEGGAFTSLNGVLCKNVDNTLELAFFPKNYTVDGVEVEEYAIPDGVTRVGAKAFYHNLNLETVTIGGHVTSIGESAFEGCMNIKKVEFLGIKNSSDLRIEKKAFYGKNDDSSTLFISKLSEVTLPANLVYLGVMAFGRNNNLKTVTVNVDRASVDFEDNAFVDIEQYRTSFVTDVNLGAGVPEFNIASVFGGALLRVNVDPDNTSYANDDTGNGVLYKKGLTEIVFFPKSYSGSYTIPETMTEIASSLFSGCTELTEIVFHNTLKRIGDLAFNGCTKLQNVNFGEEAYADLEVGVGAFRGCNKLVNIKLPEGLASLGDSVFANCSALQSVGLPSTLKTISLSADGTFTVFDGCDLLSTLTIAEGNSNYGTYDDVFYSMRQVKGEDGDEFVHSDLLFCPRGKIGVVNVPGTVRNVQKLAFEGCAITELVFEDLVATENVGDIADTNDLMLQEGALHDTPELQRLHLPEGMTKIETSIFYSTVAYEYAFEKLEIPATMTYLTADLFRGANIPAANNVVITFAEAGDKQVGGLTIADAESSSSGVFAGLNLTSITFPSQLIHLGNYALYNGLNDKNRLETVNFTVPAKDGEAYKFNLEIGNYVFYYARLLTSVTLPENLTSIGNYAFYNTGLESINIPANVTSIGSSAFAGDSGNFGIKPLTQLTFAPGSKLETIGSSAFNSQSLVEVNIPASVKEIQQGAFSKNVMLSSFTFAAPAEGEAVEDLVIGNNAFSADSALATINIPARTISIGNNAFINSGLESITFEGGAELETDEEPEDAVGAADAPAEDVPDGSHLESIGDMAFNYTQLKSIVFPRTVNDDGELKLGNNLFVGCTSLKEVTLSSTVLSISNVFAGNGTIETIKVAKANSKYVVDENGAPIIYEKGEDGGLSIALMYADTSETLTLGGTRIGAGALTNITGVKHIIISASVVEIGDRAFENCTSLEDVTIMPDSALQTVGAYVFQNCLALTTVDFSNATRLSTFADGAFPSSGAYSSNGKAADCKGLFNGCVSLQKVILGSGVTKLGVSMFSGSAVQEVDLSRATKLKEFANYAFANTPNLRTVTLPAAESNNIEHLGAFAFYCSGIVELDLSSCVKLKYAAPDLAIAQNPNSGKGIGGTSQYAANFAYAESLQTVTFPSSMLGFGQYAFRGCKSLKTLNGIENVSEFYDYCFAETGDFTLVTGDLDVTIYKYAFYKAGDVKITAPETHKITFTGASSGNYIFSESGITTWTIRTQDVYENGSYMFNKCASLRSVNVAKGGANNFTTIFSNMFKDCSALESIDFAGMENLNKIGSSAFAVTKDSKTGYNTSLDGVIDLSGTKVETIEASAFNGQIKIDKIIMPSTLTTLGNATGSSVFQDCEELATVDFTQCTLLTLIGKSAFSGCTKLDHIDLSNTAITRIYSNVFQNCSSLNDIKLPAKQQLTMIDQYAFQNCVALTSMDLSDTAIQRFTTSGTTAVSLTSAAYTFDGCINLATVKLPATLTQIGAYTFRNCTSLQTFVGPDNTAPKGITIVGNYAFQNCVKLTAFDFTDITKLGTSCFAGSGLTAVTLPDKSFAKADINASVFEDCPSLKTVNIPAGFGIEAGGANYMFRNCPQLDTIVFMTGDASEASNLPNSMFAGCTALSVVDMTDANIEAIPDGMFSGATNLKQVTLGEGIVTIGANAFAGCAILDDVNLDKVETIGAAAFEGCAFTGLTFDALASLAQDAFAGNHKLTEVTLTGDAATKFKFENNAFTSFDSKTTYVYVYPELSEGGLLDLSNVKDVKLSAYMFEDMDDVTVVKLPNGILNIPKYTFANSSVQNVDLTESKMLLTIDEGAFKDSALKSISLPASVCSIGKQAFAGTQLSTLTIPASVLTIEAGAFANCEQLTSVTFESGQEALTLGAPPAGKSNYPKAGNANLGVFENTPITSLTLGNRIKSVPMSAFANTVEREIDSVGYDLDLSDVTKVDDYAFYGSYIHSVSFGVSFNYLGAAAFAHTSKLATVTFNSLDDQKVEFKINGYESLDTRNDEDTGSSKQTPNYMGAFEGSAVSTVTNLPKLLTNKNRNALEVGPRMFKDCPNLTEITHSANVIGNYAFKNTPIESIDLTGVTAIGARAFYGTNITQVTIPDTVTSLGAGAFSFMEALNTVTIESGDGELTLPRGTTSRPDPNSSTGEYSLAARNGAFESCPQLANVTLGNRVKTIGASTFYNCTALQQIAFPEGVVIEQAAFTLTGLTSVDLTNVTSINVGAFMHTKISELQLPIHIHMENAVFKDCDELQTVTFVNPTNVTLATTENFNQLFVGCDKLQSVEICEGVTMLNMPFIDCTNLENVTLPDSLSSLSSRVFENCTGIKKLVLPTMLTTINATAFNGWGKEQQICFQISRSTAYAMTYTVTKNNNGVITGTSSPLVTLEQQCTVVYDYDPDAQADYQPSALMAQALANVPAEVKKYEW